MHAVNQRARKQSVEREKAAAQIREDQIP
jgi:hypothetical protein